MNPPNKILIIGPLPPPAGGISIHIQRLTCLLQNDFKFDFVDESVCIKKEYFNIRKLNFIKYLIKIKKADLIYIHSGNKLLKKGHIIFSKLFRKKIIITFHGFERHKNILSVITDKFIYRLANKIILVNKGIIEKINIPKHKCIICPAFLPPLMTNEQSLPDYIISLISIAKADSKTIICSNASRLNKYNEEDLYGLDICIDLSVQLLNNNIPFLFIFNVCSLDEGFDLFQKAQIAIKYYKLENVFLLINEKLSFVKLIEESNIVLRTTNTDGDAISVREAIYLNKPVIASDVVNRPYGTILFKNRNVDDLLVKFISILNKLKNNSNFHFYDNHTNLDEYINSYKNLIRNVL